MLLVTPDLVNNVDGTRMNYSVYTWMNSFVYMDEGIFTQMHVCMHRGFCFVLCMEMDEFPQGP